MVAVARLRDNVATVVNVTSCFPQFIIDTGIEILGLGVTGDTVIVVGNGKVVTWSLPVGKGGPEVRASINDSVRTIILNQSPLLLCWSPSVWISPDFNHIFIAGMYVLAAEEGGYYLSAYSMSTGKCLAEIRPGGFEVWLTSDGRKVWCSTLGRGGPPGGIVGWAIVKDNGSDLLKLERLDLTQHQPERCPWEPSRGYEVTDDGWILTSGGKRLLWSPPHWRLYPDGGVWEGRFLGLLHLKLPEAVILELPEE